MVPFATSTLSPAAREAAPDVITIASAPAGHPYVARISAADGISLLPDPPVPGAPAGVWWPPPVLDPAWIDANRSAAQLLHIHFGTESFAPGHMTTVIDAAHKAGWPVVYTAHDLEHPQLGDQVAYAGQLDELMRGADAVITLTEGAASAIRDRWDRSASVIPHPSVVAPDAVTPRVRSFDGIRIGVHLKDLRPNVDGPGTVRMLLDSADRLRRDGVPVVAEIRLHHRVRDDAARDEVRSLCAADEHATLVEHERLSDAELAIALSRLDVYVLPYRHGTHSGWLEFCWDLGVPVAAPLVGYYAEQHPDRSVATFAPGSGADLTSALASLISGSDVARAGTEERADIVAARREARRQTDEAAAAAHAALYRRLAGRPS
ncbi:hypothetical protein [Microbacterium sp.]|uniref:hypothetical protein n=1 Tax=Microbacterium sp. TaxID=51671 RepID=UPI002E34B288|nr:hypothetical protein [Microbacterium sp.]HEX5729653.1 hypothetical protein [Microbacterium sp.]